MRRVAVFALVLGAAQALGGEAAARGGAAVRQSAAALDEPLQATVACERAAGPGRVKCEVEARAPQGETLRWADVQVLASPAFASPLRARLGSRDTTAKGDDSWRFTLALVAREKGAGELVCRVRALTCGAEGACTTREVVARGAVEVGR